MKGTALLANLITCLTRSFQIPALSLQSRRTRIFGHPFRQSLNLLHASSIMSDWKSIEPSSFQTPVIDGRRIAKDENYLQSVRSIWESEEKGGRHMTEMKNVQYSAGSYNQHKLFGCLLRRRHETTANDDYSTKQSLPAILLFHTAAGPQDIFLYYKADILLQSLNCIVLICDIMSDKTGWGWDPDRSRYGERREKLMENDTYLLRECVSGAVESLIETIPQVDPQRIAAMGWCLGGQPIIELARLNHESSTTAMVQTMITFHGVFARGKPLRMPTTPTPPTDTAISPKVLICNGQEDPFVASSDLEHATGYFNANGFQVEVVQVDGAKHGFTNPAQDFNENPAFGYSREGARTTWDLAMKLLRQRIN